MTYRLTETTQTERNSNTNEPPLEYYITKTPNQHSNPSSRLEELEKKVESQRQIIKFLYGKVQGEKPVEICNKHTRDQATNPVPDEQAQREKRDLWICIYFLLDTLKRERDQHAHTAKVLHQAIGMGSACVDDVMGLSVLVDALDGRTPTSPWTPVNTFRACALTLVFATCCGTRSDLRSGLLGASHRTGVKLPDVSVVSELGTVITESPHNTQKRERVLRHLLKCSNVIQDQPRLTHNHTHPTSTAYSVFNREYRPERITHISERIERLVTYQKHLEKELSVSLGETKGLKLALEKKELELAREQERRKATREEVKTLEKELCTIRYNAAACVSPEKHVKAVRAAKELGKTALVLSQEKDMLLLKITKLKDGLRRAKIGDNTDEKALNSEQTDNAKRMEE